MPEKKREKKREKECLPIGTEFFDELRENDYYYVDKTGLIAELLRSPAAVTLFTRPHRFGKTLAMTMLKCFFEIGGDPSLFDGLAITKEKDLCERYMGKYPVVFLSLKNVDAANFTMAREMMAGVVADTAGQHRFLLESERLGKEDKNEFRKLLDRDMDELTIIYSLWMLTRLLKKHYGRRTILLIDEYDVPLQKAFYAGYYDEMVQMICNMFSQALKTNDSLEFGVLTGCLRISGGRTFTGLNHLHILSIAHPHFSGYFGFTDEEVRRLLAYYGLSDAYDAVHEWYGGYRFGDREIYCPWDVINYVDLLRADPGAAPANFRLNSSCSDAVREFVNRLGVGVMSRELEEIVAGVPVRKEIRQGVTYREMYETAENLWSLLYMTGCLTGEQEADWRTFYLTVPNMEIRDIFKTQILDLLKRQVSQDGEMVREFCSALRAGNAAKVEELFGQYLRKTVCIRDTFAGRNLKENFYHDILLEILDSKENWTVTGNCKTGDGCGDILVEAEDDGTGKTGIVIEVKYSQNADLKSAVQDALRQIEERRYAEKLQDDGIGRVLKYGIACYKKRCRVAFAD